MENNYPIFGSQWRHRSGRSYTVLDIANVASVGPAYPVTVVYVGRNGNIWAKTLVNFLETMNEIPEETKD